MRVVGLTDVTAIAAGVDSGYAVRTDGTVWAWGSNHDGKLGIGTTVPRSRVPVQVTGLTGVVDLAAGHDHGYAVREDGTAWAWGDGRYGALGNGTQCSCGVSTPVQVSWPDGQPAPVEISAIGYGALALDARGRAWVWGGNTSGEFGDGNVGSGTDYRTTPLPVPYWGDPAVGGPTVESLGDNLGPGMVVPVNNAGGGQR